MMKILDFFREKSMKKNIVRNFLQKIKILFVFDYFSENVLKTLLRGKETIKKTMLNSF